MATSHPLKTGAQFSMEGRHDFSARPRTLQPETLQLKVQKNLTGDEHQQLGATRSIWADGRTSVPSMNPISFIIPLSVEKNVQL